jgi:hypothetical protein
MTEFLIAFAVLALVAVFAGEIADIRLRRRVADAGRSRLPVPVARQRLSS